MRENGRIGLYTGSFDPVTLGHLDIIRRSLSCVDQLVIAIGIHPAKTPFLSAQERCNLLESACTECFPEAADRIKIITFSGLSVEVAQEQGASVMVRGLRDGTDFDYEMQLAGMNEKLLPGVQTFFIPASSESRMISATLVRQIHAMGGAISQFVPSTVAHHLAKRA